MLNYRDIASMLGHAKFTTMWEQWQIAKGYIETTREKSAQDYYAERMLPVIVAALSERYHCRLGPIEVRTAHDQVNVQACAILDRGELPVGSATHLIVKQVSSEGWRQTYGQSSEPYLVVDAIRASLVRQAFHSQAVGMFVMVGNGDREVFVEIPNSNEVDSAVAGVIEAFVGFVETNQEPPPDYQHDGKALLAMAAATDRRLPAYKGDDDAEFVAKVTELRKLRARQSDLDRQSREIKKEREFITGYLATILRNHSRAHVGTSVITVRQVNRNVEARIDSYSQVDIKD